MFLIILTITPCIQLLSNFYNVPIGNMSREWQKTISLLPHNSSITMGDLKTNNCEKYSEHIIIYRPVEAKTGCRFTQWTLERWPKKGMITPLLPYNEYIDESPKCDWRMGIKSKSNIRGCFTILPHSKEIIEAKIDHGHMVPHADKEVYDGHNSKSMKVITGQLSYNNRQCWATNEYLFRKLVKSGDLILTVISTKMAKNMYLGTKRIDKMPVFMTKLLLRGAIKNIVKGGFVIGYNNVVAGKQSGVCVNTTKRHYEIMNIINSDCEYKSYILLGFIISFIILILFFCGIYTYCNYVNKNNDNNSYTHLVNASV